MQAGPLIVSVEGNIGAGKTTIIDKLQEKMRSNKDILFLREPVDVWEGIKDPISGENILQKFYGNPTKYAFSFQVMAYATRISLIREAIRNNSDCKMIICERSLDADKNIFAQMLHDDGMIDNIQFQIYNRFYKEYSTDYKLDGIVYIDADADVCFRRISNRARAGESGIELSYLEKCKDYHDNWLLNKHLGTSLLRINANEEVSYDANNLNDQGVRWLNEVERYIDKLLNDKVYSYSYKQPYKMEWGHIFEGFMG
jgi:deoxyadenosine/deoxycytidine kinase